MVAEYVMNVGTSSLPLTVFKRPSTGRFVGADIFAECCCKGKLSRR